MSRKLVPQEIAHWVVGTFAGGINPDENQPFKNVSPEKIGPSVLSTPEDAEPGVRLELINRLSRALVGPTRREGGHGAFGDFMVSCHDLVDVCLDSNNEPVAIFEWKSNVARISGHGGSGEEFDMNRAATPVTDMALIQEAWQRITSRWKQDFCARNRRERYDRQVLELFKRLGIDDASVAAARRKALEDARQSGELKTD